MRDLITAFHILQVYTGAKQRFTRRLQRYTHSALVLIERDPNYCLAFSCCYPSGFLALLRCENSGPFGRVFKQAWFTCTYPLGVFRLTDATERCTALSKLLRFACCVVAIIFYSLAIYAPRFRYPRSSNIYTIHPTPSDYCNPHTLHTRAHTQ